MPRRRSVDTMERDQQAADYFRRGLSYRQISEQMGWRSPAAAHQAVRRAARDAAADRLAGPEALATMLERLQDYRRLAWRVATTRHYVLTQAGELAAGPDGKPLVDDAPVLHAIDRLVRIDAEENKLCGHYAPAKARVEVITEDAVDAELARLAAEIAKAGDGAVSADSGAA